MCLYVWIEMNTMNFAQACTAVGIQVVGHSKVEPNTISTKQQSIKSDEEESNKLLATLLSTFIYLWYLSRHMLAVMSFW